MAAILEQWIERWATLAWLQFWQVSVLFLVIAVLAPCVGRRWPHLAYLLWALVIIKCVTPPVFRFPPGVFCWWPHFPGPEIVLAPLPSGDGGETVIADLRPYELVAAGLTPISTPWLAAPRGGEALVLLCLWAIPLLCLGVWSLRRWRVAYRHLRFTSRPAPSHLANMVHQTRINMNVTRPVRVWISQAGYGPLVFGWRRPTIVLPKDLVNRASLETLKPLLTHELAHVRRADTFLAAVQYAARLLWWFHPAIWWTNRELNRYCELCCDEEAIASTGCSPKRYAQSLFAILELKPPRGPRLAAPAVAGIDAKHVTAQRLNWILAPGRGRLASTPAWCWAVALILGLTALPGDPMRKPEPPLPHLLRAAGNSAVLEQQWPKAVAAYRGVLALDPEDSEAWFLLGYCLHRGGHVKNAIGAHRMATENGRCKCFALYNWACALALLGESDKAFAKLDEAIAAGFGDAEILSADDDWLGLRSHPQFTQRLQKLQDNQPHRKLQPAAVPISG